MLLARLLEERLDSEEKGAVCLNRMLRLGESPCPLRAIPISFVNLTDATKSHQKPWRLKKRSSYTFSIVLPEPVWKGGYIPGSESHGEDMLLCFNKTFVDQN